MTEKNKYRPSQWSQKHEEFCLANKIPPAAKLLWQWLISQGQCEETEPDLSEFNDWVKKHRGKGYSRPTLKNALAKLIDCGLVSLIKQYTWKIVKIVTRPIEWLLPKKNLQKQNEIYDLQTSNPQSSENEVNSSSYPHIDTETKEEILEICNEAGINYPADKPARIFTYSVEEIKLAIASFFIRGGHERIRNPQGWLIDCLQWRYWQEMGIAL